MKAIILAAGKGTRLEPITLETPKAMVEVFWKPLLQYNMERLLSYVDEFTIVVKYKKEKILQYFWDSFQGIPIRYHEQWDEKGTGAALKGIQYSWDIIIAYADAIFSQKDVNKLMKQEGYSILAKEVKNPEKYGIFKVNTSWYIDEVVEKPQEYIGNLANFSFFKTNSDILKYVNEIQESSRWEIELTDAMNIFFKKECIFPVILQNDFIDITSIKDLDTTHNLTKPPLWETQYLDSIRNYEVHLWIPQTWIQEIVDYSLDENDTALREGTSDWKKRFISVENLSSWYNDTERYPFTLLSEDGVVAWLWWGRPAKIPSIHEVFNTDIYTALEDNCDFIHTSGVRIYPFARWARLASPFIDRCENIYSTIFSPVYMCIDIDAWNIPSQKAFEKIWYQKVGYGKNINNSPESGKKRFVYMKKY